MSALRIGISANFFYPDPARVAFSKKTLMYAEQELYTWVAEAGALPFMLPQLKNDSGTSITDMIKDMDGILFSGGADLCPKSYGEEPLRPEWSGDLNRDQYEIDVFNIAKDLGKPILGICRGHQLINVAMGGTLFQDIQTQIDNSHCHRDAEIYDGLKHDVSILPNTVLSEIYDGQEKATINTVHHQAVKDLGQGLVAMAYSEPDNILEAFCSDQDDEYIMGIQWHPEWIKDTALLPADKIRTHFLDAVTATRSE